MKLDLDSIKSKAAANKRSSFEWQKRRHPQWKESYELYRDTVVINRLTQRQSVNIPMAKATVRTILAGIDEPRETVFEELGGDKQKEIYKNEYWRYFYEKRKIRIKDIVDKKQVIMYGRSHTKLLIAGGMPDAEIQDPHDILVDRFVDPTDIDTAGHIIHQHIFRNLDELTANDEYDKEAIDRLKVNYSGEAKLLLIQENYESWLRKNERMADMGATDVQQPEVGAIIVELNEHYMKVWDADLKEMVIVLVTMCDGEILRAKPLEEILGETSDHYWRSHYPIVSWADDVERLDYYSDGWMDVVRTPNKVVNAWFSQLVENRTLRNFGMNYYDSNMEGFVPQTFEPVPFGWYPIPVGDGKKLEDVVKKIDIPDLSESLDEMQFLIGLVESATAATKNEQGSSEKGDITLGEVKLIAAKAQQRIASMSVFYQEAQREFAEKWSKLCEGGKNQIAKVTLYKKSYRGNYYKQEVVPKDWLSEDGYACRIINKAEKQEESLEGIQKLAAARQYFGGNPPFERLFQEQMLDFINATPEETKEILDFTEQALAGPAIGPPGPDGAPVPAPSLPVTPQPNAVPIA